MFIKNNNNIKILTPDGFKKFKGVKKVKKTSYLHIFFDDKSDIKCSLTHPFGKEKILASTLKKGDILQNKTIINIDYIRKDNDLYDLIDVEDNNVYYTNGLVSHNCEFLGSTHTVIDASTLEKLINKGITEPELVQLGGHFRIYEQPQKGSQYIMGADTSKGTGLDYSTIQVLKIESLQPLKLKQVAVYENNMIDPYGFAEIVNKTSLYYNKAYIMVENNSEGSVIVNQLWWEYENESLVNEGSKIAKLGVRATTKTKPKAVMLMKKLVEDEAIEIIDKNTLTQFTDFQDLGNNRFACKNMHDDLVSSLYWAIYFFELNILSEDFKMHKGLFDTVGEEDEELDGWGLLGDVENEEESWDWLTRIGA
jgi:hypothetical protein